LADDHQILREGLKALINAQPDMEVIGEAKNGRVLLTLVRQLIPDVVVMDVSMPELNGFQATERLKQMAPQIKILTLTRFSDDSYLKRLLQAGASGYVLKHSASSELIHAIHVVMGGHIHLDSTMMSSLAEDTIPLRSANRPITKNNLSSREEEVLRSVASGYANKETAARLSISIKTVEAHKAKAMQKLGMTSRIDIVRYAILVGWALDI